MIKLPQNKNKMTTKRTDDQKLIKIKFGDKETRIVRTFKKIEKLIIIVFVLNVFLIV